MIEKEDWEVSEEGFCKEEGGFKLFLMAETEVAGGLEMGEGLRGRTCQVNGTGNRMGGCILYF